MPPRQYTSARPSTPVRIVDLLGGHEGGRAEDAAGVEGDLGRIGLFEGPIVAAQRDAPVHDVDLAELADHDVGGLQIAVDDAAAVGVRGRRRRP